MGKVIELGTLCNATFFNLPALALIEALERWYFTRGLWDVEIIQNDICVVVLVKLGELGKRFVNLYTPINCGPLFIIGVEGVFNSNIVVRRSF